MSRGATPAKAGVAEVRAKTVALLKRLYRQVQSNSHKQSVIAALNNATIPSHVGTPDQEHMAMLAQNTIDVLRFYEELTSTEPLNC